MNYLLALGSALIITLFSLVGILTFSLKDKILRKILIFFVSFSAGALLGGVFFHLLPEAIHQAGKHDTIFVYTLIGIGLFFILERVMRWHHCHEVGCDTHKHLGYMNLFGDGVHNIIDGIILASAFSVSPALGWPIALSIALHEIPQEIGDYGVLLYAGFTKGKALLYNLIAASTVILGVVLGYFMINYIQHINNFLLPFAAGGFVYIAMSDLIPELHKEKTLARSLISFAVVVLALLMMYLLSSHSH